MESKCRMFDDLELEFSGTARKIVGAWTRGGAQIWASSESEAGHGQGSYHSGLAIPQSIFGILEWKIEGNGPCMTESWSYLHGDGSQGEMTPIAVSLR
jgi:hypothetical protein